MHPIILTATMGKADFAWADALRRRHFPPDRNHVPAHITLFHHLPPSCLDELTNLMRREARGSAPKAMLAGLVNLGSGVALRVECAELLVIREVIADHFAGMLTPQDEHPPRLHITVQNKVAAAEAKALHAELERDFCPRPLAIAGLAAWHYLGPHWQLAAEVRFRG